MSFNSVMSSGTTFHCSRCEELVRAYVADPSPEATLMVGGDMRKIKLCFALMKVTVIKLIAATPT